MKKLLLGTAVTIMSVSMLEAVSVATNTNNGFGGVLSSSSMDFADDGTTLTITWQTGGAAFNDNIAIYFDTTAGGVSDTSTFTDVGDGGRAAISGNGTGGGESLLTFAAGFMPDSAIAVDSSFAGLFNGLGATHNFVSSANLTGTGTGGDPYVFTATLSDLGITAGDSYKVAATYINSSNAFRSDEAFQSAGLVSGNPGAAPVTFTGFDTLTTVPEPSSTALLGLAGISLLLRRSRNA